MPYFYVDMIYEAECSILVHASDESEARRKAIVYLEENEGSSSKIQMCKVTKSRKLITNQKGDA